MSSTCGDSVPKVLGYDNLQYEGSTVTFVCPPGLVLIGSSSATCTENGEWEPDPSGLMCGGKLIILPLKQAGTIESWSFNPC